MRDDIDFRLIADTVPHMVWISRPDGFTEFLNEYFSRYAGVSVEEAYGWDWLKLVHPEDAAKARETWQRAITSEAPYESQYRMRRADGQYRWHVSRGTPLRDEAGKIRKWVGTSTDIDELKQAESHVAEAQRRTEESLALLDTLQATAPVGFGFVDTDLRFARVNKTLAAINGVSEEQHIGRTVAEVLPELWIELEPYYRHVLATGEPVASVEISGETRAKPGHIRHWLASYYPVRVQDALIGIGIFFAEVTERRRVEEQIRELQKMEAVGRLAGGIAHDFNNLLTIINGDAELLLYSVGATAPHRRFVEEIKETAERAALLTRRLLAFSRKQVLAPRVVDLNVVIRDAERMLRRVLGEDIELVVTLTPQEGFVRVDPVQIEQVILNLAINARDAMPQGGRLLLETQGVILDASHLGPRDVIEPGDYVVLTVSDNGEGMDAETRAHLFEPFYTTKEPGKGTGLGLAIVYGVIRQSSGYIDVMSERGIGSTFKLYLPRVIVHGAPSDAPVPRSTTTPRGSETVLVVEDERGVRVLVRRILEHHGYTVLEASGGAEALQIARDHAGRIELLITDVVMPEMNGRRLAEALLSMRPDTKVIYMSGHTEDSMVRHGVLAARVDYLQKPFTAAVLATKVRDVLDRSEGLDLDPESGG